MKKAIAFFDFDGTLTFGDTLIPFLRFYRGTPLLCLDLLQTSPFLAAYALGLVQNDKAKQTLLKQSLGSCNIHELRDHGYRFAKQHLAQMIRSDTFERLRTHQRNGDRCVLVSASLDIYLKPWAHSHDLDLCMSSSLKTDIDDKVTGLLHRGNCYGENKVNRIKKLFNKIGTPSKTYAYGNSEGDIPMLKFVDEGYWVTDSITRFSE